MERRRFDWLTLLYALVAALLITHEIDGAYFEEWRLFGLPWGIQGYVWFNLVVVLIALWGLVAVARGRAWGAYLAVAVAATGVAAFFIHLYFNLTGHPGFDNAASWAVLGMALALSPWLGVAAVARISGRAERRVRKPSAETAPPAAAPSTEPPTDQPAPD